MVVLTASFPRWTGTIIHSLGSLVQHGCEGEILVGEWANRNHGVCFELEKVPKEIRGQIQE